MAAMVSRNDDFQRSMVRAEYAQQLISRTEATRYIAYAKHKQLLRDSDYTVAQLKEFLGADDSKMLGMPEVD